MKKVIAIAILSLSLSSCEEAFNPTICLTCVADSYKDVAEVPLAGFPNYGKQTDGRNFELCDQPKGSKNTTEVREGSYYVYRNGIGYKINRSQIYTCNPKP
jgi:hypothetical protein